VGTILGIKVKKHSSDYAPNQSHYTIKSNKWTIRELLEIHTISYSLLK
jgi:hypothetical protein